MVRASGAGSLPFAEIPELLRLTFIHFRRRAIAPRRNKSRLNVTQIRQRYMYVRGRLWGQALSLSPCVSVRKRRERTELENNQLVGL